MNSLHTKGRNNSRKSWVETEVVEILILYMYSYRYLYGGASAVLQYR